MESQNCHVIGNAALAGRTFITMAEAYRANGGHVGLRMGPAPAAAALTVETANPFAVGDRVILADDPTPEVLTDMKRGRVTDVDDDWCVVSWDSGTSGGYRPVKLSTAPLPGGEPLPSLQSTPDAPDRVAGPVAVAEPLPVYTQRRVATVETTGNDYAVSDIALRRINEEQAHWAKHGIALSPPVVTRGGRVNETGRSNFAKSHREWGENPETVVGLQAIADAVKTEQREDVLIDCRKDLRMLDDGSLDWGDGPIAVEEPALKLLANLFGDQLPSAGPLLMVLDTERRARLVNEQLARSERDGSIKIRTRQVNGVRQGFAFVGPNYGTCDADTLAVMLTEALNDNGCTGARGEVTYNPSTTDIRVDALFHRDHVVDLAAGDVFKAGMHFRSNDAAGGSIQGRLDVWRNRCYNLIIIGKGSKPLFRVVHKGTMRGVIRRIRNGIHVGMQALGPALEQWGQLRQVKAADAIAGVTGDNAVQRARSAYEQLLDMKLAGADYPLRRDAMVEAMLRGWQAEPGETLADLLNGVTRIHEERYLVGAQLERLESTAGLLLPKLATMARATA